jgi:hypothetical protein
MGELVASEKMGFDRDACSYVIRMWHERAIDEQEKGEWRGWILHVQSGKRIFFRDMAAITSFINEYLCKSYQS